MRAILSNLLRTANERRGYETRSVIAVVAALHATTPSYAQDLINGALTAMGGADALTQVKHRGEGHRAVLGS